MTKIYSLNEIRKALDTFDPVPSIEEGFVLYSQGKTVVPPVGELLFENPPGDVHIKYGYIRNDPYYAIKIASGFYETSKSTQYTSSGLMLLFKQRTGELACVLHEECYLTHVRTAAAGAIAAKYLAPKNVHRIGIFGSGTQGRMQLEYLKPVTQCRDVIVWGRDRGHLEKYKNHVEKHGFHVDCTMNSEDVAKTCNLIVMATPSTSPLLRENQIRRGTHITAMGSDTPSKQELDPRIFQKADLIVADSISQCILRGEIHHALKERLIQKDSIVELGNVIANKAFQRSSDEQTTVADLTGVAVQDIQIAKGVYLALISS